MTGKLILEELADHYLGANKVSRNGEVRNLEGQDGQQYGDLLRPTLCCRSHGGVCETRLIDEWQGVGEQAASGM